MNSIVKKAGIFLSVIIVTCFASSNAQATPPAEAVKATIDSEIQQAIGSLQAAGHLLRNGDRGGAGVRLRESVAHVQNAGNALGLLARYIGPSHPIIQSLAQVLTQITANVQHLARFVG